MYHSIHLHNRENSKNNGHLFMIFLPSIIFAFVLFLYLFNTKSHQNLSLSTEVLNNNSEPNNQVLGNQVQLDK